MPSDLPHEHYELAEWEHRVTDPTSGQEIPVRLIFVYSTADERESRQRRHDQIAALHAGLAHLQARLSRGHPRCTAQTIGQQVLRLLGKKEAGRYFTWQLVALTAAEQAALPEPGNGHCRARHRLEFHCDAAAAQAAERYDGLAVLVTTALGVSNVRFVALSCSVRYGDSPVYVVKSPVCDAKVMT